MHRVITVLGVLLVVAVNWAKASDPVTVHSAGWTVSADSKQSVLTIEHDGLGTVLQQVRLNLRGPQGLRRLTGWSVDEKGASLLSIRTADPRTAWLLELAPEKLRISTSSADGVLTGEAPASSQRIVVRLLDREGTPVNWMMTPETKRNYGGVEASNPSFLPRRNPDVMYFALGQAESAHFHSLFDRNADAAIDFSEQTTMHRLPHQLDLLDITIPVPGNTLVRFTADYFTKVLGLPFYVPFDDSEFPRPPMVWDSWATYYEHVTEEGVVRNADWIAANLKPYGYQYVQIDEGYDMDESRTHYWTERWDKKRFPHGPKWLADYIKSKGLIPGLWLVPNTSQIPVEQHPDWFLRCTADGKIILDYDAPTLDPTNPEVLEFLRQEMTKLDDFGFEYYKFDGEHDFLKYVPGVDLERIANKSIDPIEAYRNRLKIIRDVVGPHRFIEGCPAGTPLDGIGYFNSFYTGEDTSKSWLGMYSLFSSLNANAFLNHVAAYVMPGEMDLEPAMSVAEAAKRQPPAVIENARSRENTLQSLGVTTAEARTIVSYVALSGTVYSMGSMMPTLPPDRARLLKMTLPTMPILPIDLFSRGTDMPMWELFKHTTADDYIHNYPEILDLKVNAPAGAYDVAALTNWRSWPTTRSLTFAEKLGLNPKASYAVFDFWGQKLLGRFKGGMDVAIGPHDTQVLLIHPLEEHPQLVGTSRHISGAYSIDKLAWDSARNAIRGTSSTVPGDDYTLWFYVPNGASVSQAKAVTKSHSDLSAREAVKGNSLSVTLVGQAEPVDWEVEFKAGAAK